jgi:UDP-N-acetylglucosamine acyltransferase
MNFSHVAHDSHLGSRCILANGATLAGHVTVEDFVIVGGLAGIHQFARLGESSMIAAGAMVAQDVPPYCMVQGDRAALVGLNAEGLRRRGFSPQTIRALRRAYRGLFRGGTPLTEATARVRTDLGGVAEVARLVDFVAGSKRGVCRPRVRGDADDDGEE